MRNFLNKALMACKNYTLWDWFFLKLTLMFFGIVVGLVFREFLLPYMVPIFILFGVSYLGLAYKTFFKYWGK
jgi:hypothetical protein